MHKHRNVRRSLTIAALLAAISPVSAEDTTDAATSQAVQVRAMHAPNGGIQPQAVVDAGGTVHLVYFKGQPRAGDVYYVKSTGGDASFSKPLRVNSQPKSAVATGTVRGAQLTLGRRGWVHVAWNGSSQARPRGPLNPEMPPDSPHNGTPMLYTRLNASGDAFEPQRNVMGFTFGLDGGGSVAADKKGNVFVIWHAGSGRSAKEVNRTVWIAKSSNDGKTFRREFNADPARLGVCGCCGLRSFTGSRGEIYVLYRTATDKVNRDVRLLVSRGGDSRFRGVTLDTWRIPRCVMSTSAMAEYKGQVTSHPLSATTTAEADPSLDRELTREEAEGLVRSDPEGAIFLLIALSAKLAQLQAVPSAPPGETLQGQLLCAWETKKQVYLGALKLETRRLVWRTAAPGWGRNRKHPVLAVNDKDQILLAWTEDTAWNRGGSVAWQVFDAKGRPVDGLGKATGLKVWSLPTAFTRKDGSFVVMY